MRAGQSIGPYQVLRQINRGGQGRVLLGYDPRLHRRVAIKIYALPADRRGRRKSLNEARVIAGLDSPRIVRIFDVVVVQDYLAMVMEYVPGCDLEELLEAQTLTVANVVSIAQDLAAAIAVARHAQLVHGDIKAANVLLSEDGRAKLSDFGIARRSFQAGNGAGSPSSVAPEQLSGDPLDVRTDLFALGCLIYRMLTGKHAYPDHERLLASSTMHGSMNTSGSLTVEPLSGCGEPVPPKLAALVSSLLEPAAERRPQNTHEVRRILREVSREFPLAKSHRLRHCVSVSSRVESPDDLPPEIPEAFQQGSRRPSAQSLLATQRRPTWQYCAAVMLTGVAVTLGVLGWRYVTRPQLAVATPLVSIATDRILPSGLTRAWLRDELARAVSDARYFVEVMEEGVTGAADATLKLDLRCHGELCMLALSREGERSVAREHSILFPDAPLAAWHSTLADMTARVVEDL